MEDDPAGPRGARGGGVAGIVRKNVRGPDGSCKVHRKLKPTGSERVVWGDADKGYFPVTSTPWGPIGSLICWESYMPLARVALYQKGITIYISPNTNDQPGVAGHHSAHSDRGQVLLR